MEYWKFELQLKFLLMKTINEAQKNVVRLMRQIRDQLSLELINVSPDEQTKHIKKQLSLLKSKRKTQAHTKD